MTRKAQRAGFRGLSCTLALLSVLVAPARAVTPDEMLKDTALEMRARNISRGLRCVVCQNQSIDDSDAPLAHDLRILVRERLIAGDTDEQAIGFVVSRYGSFVLLKPPMQLSTLALWFGPALFLLIAGLVFGRYLGRSSATPAPELTASFTPMEQERLDALLKEGGMS
jgi:cytochrome c-type biogenesis protein CcmH